MVRGRKVNSIDIDGIVARLKKKFEEEVVEAFIRCKRYDLLAGYVNTEGIQQPSNGTKIHGKLIFLKDGKVAIKKEDSNYPLANEEKRDNGSDTRYVKPNLDWKKECQGFVSDKYFEELLRLQELVLRNGNGWDAIAFASRVPFALSGAFEDKIISLNDSLLILAYANDVEGADIDKLRKSIERIDPRRPEVDPYELRDHIAKFHGRHGFAKPEEAQGAQPEA